jgi:hypothetical protein
MSSLINAFNKYYEEYQYNLFFGKEYLDKHPISKQIYDDYINSLPDAKNGYTKQKIVEILSISFYKYSYGCGIQTPMWVLRNFPINELFYELCWVLFNMQKNLQLSCKHKFHPYQFPENCKITNQQLALHTEFNDEIGLNSKSTVCQYCRLIKNE